MGRTKDILMTPFGFLFSTSKKETVVAEYVIREHRNGRALDDILKDAYVTNRLAPTQVDRLLDRPDVLESIGNDMVAAHRAGRNGNG
jgi:hypothetical protein